MRLFINPFLNAASLFYIVSAKLRIPILNSPELVWLKWIFFAFRCINNNTVRKNTLSEAKIANNKPMLLAFLEDRVSGENCYA